MARVAGPLFVLLFSLILSSCSGTSSAPTPPQTLSHGSSTASPPLPVPGQAPTGGADPPGVQASVPVATPVPVVREPQPATEDTWVSDRVRAVVALYGITPEGERALAGLDVRRMRDEPGFFGSYGYKSWTGIGEARPIGVVHELSHSYFGLFPVTDHPDLGWDVPRGNDLSPAIERYHSDVLKFMGQPPDSFEPLRERLRNLPELSSDNPGPLFHTIEADAVHTVAGNLHLLPPILRKYWDRFLSPGEFLSWYDALGWYRGLPPEERRLADRYLGFQHFDLRDSTARFGLQEPGLPRAVQETLSGEERQRLEDFGEVFDLIVGSPGRDEDFRFWRRYLRDKVALHRLYPEVLANLEAAGSGQAASALAFLGDLESSSPDKRYKMVVQELGVRPFLAHFLPALDDRTLLELFSSDAPLPAGALLKGTAAFVSTLQTLAPRVDRVLEAGATDATVGAGELRAFLKTMDFEKDKDLLDLFFELFHGAAEPTAAEISKALDDATLRRLLIPVSSWLHVLLGPERMLQALDITLDSSPDELAQGIDDMVTNPSGNFRIDEPFVQEMYRVVASRAGLAPAETLEALAGAPFPMDGFIRSHPEAAVALLETDLDVTSRMIKVSDRALFPPARFVYRLVHAGPALAARLTALLGDQGEADLVVEILAHFAYDAERLENVPALAISLERDARFLEMLLDARGAEWLEGRIGDVVTVYGRRTAQKEVPSDFLSAYRRTLGEAAATLKGESALTFRDILGRVFRARHPGEGIPDRISP